VKVLHIQSSPRGESSNSIALTNAFIDACQSRDNSLVIDTLNVWNENLPEFDSEAIGAKYKAVKNESMTKRESAVWRQVQALIQRFQRADRIVLGSPMWNFAPPL
jgi:FMN-dependent NADH-azoreductase